MVNALKEAWRVLTPRGVLLDLRPLAQDMSIEIACQDSVAVTGFVDGAPGKPHDDACDVSLASVQGEGWFASEHQRVFDLPVYFDTVDDMQRYLEENFRVRHAALEDDVLEHARRTLARETKGARVRLRHRLLLARYRRCSR